MQCIVCLGVIIKSSEYLRCVSCSKTIHVKCLDQQLATNLLGDVFFEFHCKSCWKPEGRVQRKRLSWFETAVLALYNLNERYFKSSQNGYFRLAQIKKFILDNWITLFGANVSIATPIYLNSVLCNNISINVPTYFTSGGKEIGKRGWWKLTNVTAPRYIIEKKNDKSKKFESNNQTESGENFESVEGILTEVSEDSQNFTRLGENDSNNEPPASVVNNRKPKVGIINSSVNTSKIGDMDASPEIEAEATLPAVSEEPHFFIMPGENYPDDLYAY